jgi:hypothetical protein
MSAWMPSRDGITGRGNSGESGEGNFGRWGQAGRVGSDDCRVAASNFLSAVL